MSESFERRVMPSFLTYVRQTALPPTHQCLADYIYSWVKSGRGARVCQRDFALLQTACLLIADHWCRFPHLTDYRPFDGSAVVERRVVTIFKSFPRDVEHPILDPSIFR